METRLEAAQRHVRQGQLIVEAQEALVFRIRASGGDSAQAENILLAFVASQSIFEEDLLYFLSRHPP
jgi:hypothetical protein